MNCNGNCYKNGKAGGGAGGRRVRGDGVFLPTRAGGRSGGGGFNAVGQLTCGDIESVCVGGSACVQLSTYRTNTTSRLGGFCQTMVPKTMPP